MNSIQGGVFQQDNTRPHTAVVTQHALQSVDMLPWPARLPDLSPIEHVWDTYLEEVPPQPALIVPVLTDQVQQAWNSIPKLTSGTCTTQCTHVCIQISGGCAGYYCTRISHLKWLFSCLH
ncbi:hypothetical protein AVEN_50666-1 [Araneus ventricosus]|uniref:Tc1-like transposase DDE domain-containing protein n=1 Tax=Araneus ventricosus TaxID=182803 RepID=A0A4Y2JJB6_ARAVE|nr:hypothetical protein AVEN_50666-1 [Araneus ventricosus]